MRPALASILCDSAAAASPTAVAYSAPSLFPSPLTFCDPPPPPHPTPPLATLALMKVAVIRSAGTPEQQQWLGSLEDIADITAGASLSPCIIVIGDVVSLGATPSPSASQSS